MNFDLHTHHQRCGHAEGTIEDYIEAAIKAGLQVIGISDHSPFFGEKSDHAHPGAAMAISQFEEYIQEVIRLKDKYRGRIDVLLGVESDFFPEHQTLYRQVYSGLPLDYVIGSVHYVRDLHIFDSRRWEQQADSLYEEDQEHYYALIQQSVHSGMFNIIGHMDGLKGNLPRAYPMRTDLIDATLKLIAGAGIAIEINTSGKRKSCLAWFPSDEILERACYYGAQITFGSDSHSPWQVGFELELVRQKLRHIGFTQWVYFRNRIPQSIAL